MLSAERGQGVVRSGEPRTQPLQFCHGAFAVISFERFDCILHDGDAPASLQQTFCGEADAVFRHHSEHDELSMISQPPHQFVCVPAFKNIQCLLFEQDLLVLRQVFRQRRGCIIGNTRDFAGQRLRD
jgi:hypothetical protein